MRWAWLSALMLAGALTLLPRVSLAGVPTRLVYSRSQSATDCPDEAALAAAVAARLGYEPFSIWGDQTILATVARQGTELIGHAELINHDGIAQGSRKVRVAGAGCDELILALALAISITLDPLHVDAAPGATAEPTPEKAEAAEPTKDTAAMADEPISAAPAPILRPPAAPKPRRVDRGPLLTWHISAAALGAFEVTPQLSFGGRLGIGARRGRWSVGLEGWTTFPTEQESDDGGEVRVSLTSAAITPCFALVPEVSLCALGSLGSMLAEGRGVEEPRTDRVLYATAGGRGLVVLPLGSTFDFVAHADLAAVLNRPRFQLDRQDVWQPGPVVALFGLGVSARFF
jgi:hypothetical protein